ncbi:MAG: ATP-binding protein [Euryarchaeota archaeon]|nr:ATP-binding protein [Euryarchaeota archaeon]
MIEIIRTILGEWKGRELPEVIERSVDLLDYSHIEPCKIIVITGFRRTGKTYLAYHLIKRLLEAEGKSREQVVYVNFEDERIPLETTFLTTLLPTIKKTHTEQLEFLFLDEIQNIPNWSRWLRRVYDTEKIRFFVTGSSSKMSSREIPTELRGRFLEVKIFPLSFREFLQFKDININEETVAYSEDEKAKLMGALREYLEFGGMPEVVLASEGEKSELIHSYYNTVVRRDIIERFKIRNEESLKALLRLLLNSTSYTISKLYNNLKSLNYEVGKGTIQSYLSYIEDSYFIYSLPLFSFKIKNQLQYARKVYFIDTSFLNLLSARFTKNSGRLYENLVFIELKRRQANDPNLEIYYWRSAQKEEVDFVLKHGLKVEQLIQVCYDINDYDTKRRETKALLKASKELKCNNLFVITEDYDAFEEIKRKRIVYIPLWRWILQNKINYRHRLTQTDDKN